MTRKGRRDNSKLREMMAEYGVKTMEDVHNFVKMLTAETIQTALDAELESELGYFKIRLQKQGYRQQPEQVFPKDGSRQPGGDADQRPARPAGRV